MERCGKLVSESEKCIPIFLCDGSSMVKSKNVKDWHRNDTANKQANRRDIIKPDVCLITFMYPHYCTLNPAYKPEGHDNKKSQDDSLYEPLTDAALIKRWALEQAD